MDLKSQRQAFLNAIAAAPRAVAPRMAFADWLEENAESDADYDLAAQQRYIVAHTPAYQDAEDWMRNFARECGLTCVSGYGGGDYDPATGEYDSSGQDWRKITCDMVVQAGHDFIDREEHFIQVGAEDARDLMWRGGTRELYWKHWQVLTGRTVSEEARQDSPFSCSC